MFDKFTDRARKVMSLAREEAQRFNHEYIGTEHILLGLVQEGSGIAARVLTNLDVELKRIRTETEKLIPHGPPSVQMGQLPFTPRAKRVLELAQKEASDLGHDYIGTEHILLALLAEGEGVAAQVLLNFGLKLDDLRAEVLECLGVTEPRTADRDPPAVASRRTERGHPLSLEQVVIALASDLACPIPKWPLSAERLGPGVGQALREAQRLAARSPDRTVLPEHLLAAIVDKLAPTFSEVLDRHCVTREVLLRFLPRVEGANDAGGPPGENPQYSPIVSRIVESAWALAQERGFEKLHTELILVALVHEADPSVREFLGRLVVLLSALEADIREAFEGWSPAAQRKPRWRRVRPLPLSAGVWGALTAIFTEATRLRHERMGLDHLLWSLLADDTEREAARKAMERRNSDRSDARPRFDLPAATALDRALDLASAMGHTEVVEDHLLCACLSLEDEIPRGFVPWPQGESHRRLQGTWERLQRRPIPLSLALGQAKVLAADSVSCIHQASHHAASDGKPAIEPDHLLSAILDAPQGAASRLLSSLRANRDAPALVWNPAAHSDPEPPGTSCLPISPSAVAVIAMAAEEAFALGSKQVDTDHLLLGLLRATESEACRALACVGVRLQDARIAALEQVLDRQA